MQPLTIWQTLSQASCLKSSHSKSEPHQAYIHWTILISVSCLSLQKSSFFSARFSEERGVSVNKGESLLKSLQQFWTQELIRICSTYSTNHITLNRKTPNIPRNSCQVLYSNIWTNKSNTTGNKEDSTKLPSYPNRQTEGYFYYFYHQLYVSKESLFTVVKSMAALILTESNSRKGSQANNISWSFKHFSSLQQHLAWAVSNDVLHCCTDI